MNAALGLAQLEQLEDFVNNKRETASKYLAFCEEQNISFFKDREDEKSNYWLNAIILENREQRDAFLKESNESGVMTRPIWKLMNKLPMFDNCPKGDLSNAEWLEDRVINIPSSVR